MSYLPSMPNASLNRWVEGLGIRADPAMVQMAANRLHAQGYQEIL